jgi:hypothetical protein
MRTIATPASDENDPGATRHRVSDAGPRSTLRINASPEMFIIANMF